MDSRLVTEGAEIRRRRRCTACGERFTTYEKAEESLPRVVKRDGARTEFDVERVRTGMAKALEKRSAPAPAVEAAIGRIRRRLPRGAGREVTTRQIGEWVMHELRALDHVAYVRFASVHRRFEDVTEFRAVLERLERDSDPEAGGRQLPLISGDRSSDGE